MSLNYENDYNYANTRLVDSLVRLEDGSPFYVLTVQNDGYVIGIVNNNHKELRVPIKDLNLEPVKLGYMNSKRKAGYLMRIPERKWKQGLRERNIYSKDGVTVNILSPNLFNTIRGIYPSLKDCVDYLYNDEVLSSAFSRDFSVYTKGASKKIYLRYKYFTVGKVDLVGGVALPKLDNNFDYLNECMNEVLDKNA